jgi:two-component system LytT family sensor kinase
MVLKKSNIYILVHFICWLILAAGFLYTHPTGMGITVTSDFWIRQTMLLIILMTVFYVNYYLLIPRLLIQKKVVIYILVVAVLLAVVTCINDLVNSVFHLIPFKFNGPQPHFRFGGPGPHGDHPGPPRIMRIDLDLR